MCHCVKRDLAESYHCLNIGRPQSQIQTGPYVVCSSFGHNDFSSSHEFRVSPSNFLYPNNDLVSKSIEQIGKNANGFVSSDSDFYEKFSQAINSSYDLIRTAHFSCNHGKSFVSMIIPIVAVPNNRLWRIQYDDNGNTVGKPELVDRASSYISQKWKVGKVSDDSMMSDAVNYWISHLEIMTENGLQEFLDSRFGVSARWNDLFTDKTIEELFYRKSFCGN